MRKRSREVDYSSLENLKNRKKAQVNAERLKNWKEGWVKITLFVPAKKLNEQPSDEILAIKKVEEDSKRHAYEVLKFFTKERKNIKKAMSFYSAFHAEHSQEQIKFTDEFYIQNAEIQRQKLEVEQEKSVEATEPANFDDARGRVLGFDFE